MAPSSFLQMAFQEPQILVHAARGCGEDVGGVRIARLVRQGLDDARAVHADRAVVTAATSARAARAGVWCVRVHDVTATVDAIDVAAALGELR